MHVQIPADYSSIVQGLITSGRFRNEEEVVAEGLRLLVSREQLRGEIQRGIDQLDAGQWIDEETVFDEVNAEIDTAVEIVRVIRGDRDIQSL